MPSSLRFEIFTSPALTVPTVEFYSQVLGFEVVQEKPKYTKLRRDAVSFAIVERDEKLSTDKRAPPHGIELILEVDDIDGEYEKATDKLMAEGATRKWDMVSGLEEKEDGLKDFRVTDPAGYCVRISASSSAQ
jgi:catechol 2,3-dioxygenase-like lactoylglutathione lyase family enzyme